MSITAASSKQDFFLIKREIKIKKNNFYKIMIENYLKLKEKIKNMIYKSMKNDERIIIKLPSVWFLFTLSNLFSISFLNIIPEYINEIYLK